jgi:hypothetical protein
MQVAVIGTGTVGNAVTCTLRRLDTTSCQSGAVREISKPTSPTSEVSVTFSTAVGAKGDTTQVVLSTPWELE